MKRKDLKNQKIPHLLQEKTKDCQPPLRQKLLEFLKHLETDVRKEFPRLDIVLKDCEPIYDLIKTIWVELKTKYDPNANKRDSKTSQKKPRKGN